MCQQTGILLEDFDNDNYRVILSLGYSLDWQAVRANSRTILGHMIRDGHTRKKTVI
jgi:hypothetical protein